MSSKGFWFGIGLVLLSACGGGDHGDGLGSSAPVSLTRPANYVLKWQDDFNAASLSSDWAYDTGAPLYGGTVWGNNEKQYYRSQNASLSNGKLVIQPAAIAAGGDITSSEISSKGLLATSARVKTDTASYYSALNGTPYGFYEIRAQIPCVAGAWPAIWMMGQNGAWPDRGEIDIMEWFGRYFVGTEQVQSGVHTKNRFGETSIYAKKTLTGLCSGYHTYQLLWTATSLTMGVDGVQIFSYNKPAGAGVADWPFDQPAFLILNVAVGGNLGGNVDSGLLPQMSLSVDWVKVWQP